MKRSQTVEQQEKGHMKEFKGKELENKIKEIISQMTGMDKEEIKSSAHFYKDLGIDSIKGIELTVALQSEFNIRIDDSRIPKLINVNLVVEEVKRLLSK